MKRTYSIDILRIISAVAVIIIHIVSAPVTNSVVELDRILVERLNVIHLLMNWSVPVFFMITGYCMARKKECSYQYCFSHVIKYVFVLLTVGLFYALLEEVFLQKTINFSVLCISLRNVISGNIWDHMWYVYTIIGVYLVMPVIHGFMQRGKNELSILTVLLFLFTVLFPTIENVLPVGVSIPFGGYLFYVCFGGLVAQGGITNKLLYMIAPLGLLSAVWIIFGPDTQKFGYCHLAVCFMAMNIFLFVSKMDIKPSKTILCISSCTWGIYLLHPFFINVVIKLLKINVLSVLPNIKLLFFALFVSFSSFAATFILRKIPYIKKLF